MLTLTPIYKPIDKPIQTSTSIPIPTSKKLNQEKMKTRHYNINNKVLIGLPIGQWGIVKHLGNLDFLKRINNRIYKFYRNVLWSTIIDLIHKPGREDQDLPNSVQ